MPHSPTLTAVQHGFQQSSHAAIIIATDAPRWTVLAANNAYVTVTHSTLADLIGRSIFAPFPESAATSAHSGIRHIEDSFVRAAQGETVVLPVQRYDLASGRGDGEFEEHYWQLSSAPLRDDTGAIIGVLHEVENVTSLHKAEQAQAVLEQQLQTVLAQAPAAIGVTVGPEHRFIVANQGYEQLVGRKLTTGQTFADSMPELVEQGYQALLDQVFQSGTPYVASEAYALVYKDGHAPTDGWYDFVYQPLVGTNGDVIGVLQQGIDVTRQVTARKQAEAAIARLDRAREAAEAANIAKTDFLAVMSHELRTPLNAIGGYVDLMQMGIRGPLTDVQRDDLSRIQKSQRHLLGLITDVLNYTRVEAGQLLYDVDDLPLDDTLGVCEALIAPQMQLKGMVFVVERCDAAWTARGDREKVRQIVLNLLSNAVKFTERGGTVVLSCSLTNDRARITVSDTGRGIPAEQRERIFEPFVQVDARLTRTEQGVGLGLAISRDLARGMRGDLVLESAPGAGSVFALSLPLR